MFDLLVAIRHLGVGAVVRNGFSRCDSVYARISTLGGALLIAAIGVPTARAVAEPPSATPNAPAANGPDPSVIAAWQENGFPLMESYCIDCHNEDTKEAGLDLSLYENLSDLSASEVRRIIEMVQFGAMPPEDYEVPETAERKQLVAALEQTIFSSTCDLTPRAGKVTVRRLNRSEYNRSIRDLFGMDLRPADAFPSDEVGAGFDNNGDVLSLSPMLIEKYIEAAESVSKQVLIDPRDLPRLDVNVPADQIPIYGDPQIGRFGGRFVDNQSFAWLDVEAPFDGRYRVQLRGGVSDDDHDSARVAIFDGDGKLLAVDKLDYFGGGGSADSMNETIELTKGKHRIAFVPVLDDRELVVGETLTDVVASMDEDRAKKILAAIGKPRDPDRRIDEDKYRFMYRGIEIDGPRDYPNEAFPPKQFQIVRKEPPRKGRSYRDVAETAEKNLAPLMGQVFRSPVSDEDVRPYAELVEQVTRDGESFHRGMQVALSAVLVSPRFLFRVETPDSDTEPNEFGDVPLSQHQIATRLSYFLWSSTPDRTLLEQAERNQLDAKRLTDHVRRMIADERAESLASDFAAQWLGLRNLDGHEADGERFPAFDDELKQAMAQETQMLFMHILRHNLSIKEFLTADYSFVNPVLAKHYGVSADGKGFQKVSLAETPRRGLLSHASILTLTSTPTRTSPVLRGKWILENVLGIKAPEPPAGVPNLDENPELDSNATLREQLEVHRQSPTCSSCHTVMDQLGFGLDDFDAIGSYRTEDAGKPIDASGALPDGRSFNGGAQLSQMLGDTETDAFARTLIERLLTFAIGRELTPDDRCTIDEVFAKTKPNEFRLADIFAEVVASRQFRFQTTDAARDAG